MKMNRQPAAPGGSPSAPAQSKTPARPNESVEQVPADDRQPAERRNDDNDDDQTRAGN